MSITLRRTTVFCAVAVAGMLAGACQQSSTNDMASAANTAVTSNAAGGFNATAAPAAAPAPAAPDPSTATGPLALAADASLPAPCQTYVREAQACLDTLADPDEAFYAGSVRSIVHSRRETWQGAQDDSYRTRICSGDVTSFREMKQRRFHC